ncbi:hypothetical protein G6F37_003072 [Rhizopus arrhizus]|nr:hypothetical protein G6F38_004048 [Rhizopus arrhizus]KAG1161445.1 hypothetical protein G6F37_003072 [Rhizopus arrhizus]
MSNEDFAHFTKEILVDPAKLISWCPTADLVLIVSPDDNISLYRFTIKQLTLLWTSAFDSTITAVTWKPNGKELVIGCENGIVYKVDTRYENLKISPCWSSNAAEKSAIRCFAWTTYDTKKTQENIKGFDPKAFELESSLPLLSDDPPVEPLSRIPIPRRQIKVLPEKPSESTEIQTLLLIGTNEGHVYVILNGIYQIGVIKINQALQKGTSILNITTEINMKSLFILTQSDEYDSVMIDTHILEIKKEEIFNISKIQTQLNYLFKYATYTLDVLKRHYDSFTRQTKTIITNTIDVIMNQSGEIQNPMPEVEFVAILATGNFSPISRELMTDYLTPQIVKQWESTNHNGYQNSLVTICEYVLPVLDRILLQLSHLLGYGLWKERYSEFLDPDSIEECISRVQKLIFQVRELACQLRRLIKLFKAFIKWIHLVSLKTSDPESVELQNLSNLCEEPEFVFEYLEEWFIQDNLAKYFVDSKDSKNSLNIQLFNIIEYCSNMLQKPSQNISKKMKVTSTNNFQLENVPKHTITSFISTNEKSTQAIYYALLQQDQKVLLDQIEFKDMITKALDSQDVQFKRSITLNNMIDVKLGCNGIPKRRIFAIVASNCLLNIYSMDRQEFDDDE